VVHGVNGIKVARHLDEIGTGVAFVELREHRIVYRLHRAGDEQAASLAEARQQLAMLQQMLDLDGRVVGQVRELLVQRVHDAHGVRGTVEEVRIAEGDVLGAGADLLANVRERDLRLDHPKTSLIYRHHRAMAAQMLAAPAGFGVPDASGCSSDAQPCVFLDGREAGAPRDLETQAIERDQRFQLRTARVPGRQTSGERHQTRLEFATQDGPGADAPQVRFVQRSVQPVTTDVRVWIQLPHLLDDLGRQTRRGVHRQVESD
jgi:hypothetical protein